MKIKIKDSSFFKDVKIAAATFKEHGTLLCLFDFRAILYFTLNWQNQTILGNSRIIGMPHSRRMM